MPHLSLRRLVRRPVFKAAMAALSVLLAAPGSCGGGSGGGTGAGYVVPDPTTQMLAPTDPPQIMAQAANAVANAGASGAVIAVVDRLGNVVALTVEGAPPSQPTGPLCAAQPCSLITTGATGGLEGKIVPTADAAISKAITAAYLSSGGNAFSTRTANQIIQQHFPLQDKGMPGGPLFGVQFSQLVCSDLISFSNGKTSGPHAAPLGLAADAGGLPLYKNGVVVGGIGVMTGDVYSINPSRTLVASTDEAVALAGESGFGPPSPIEATNINVATTTLDYLGPSAVPPTSTTPVAVVLPPGFAIGLGPVQYGTQASGIVPDAKAADPVYTASFPNLPLFVLVDPATNLNRYNPMTSAAFNGAGANAPAKAPTDGNGITRSEAVALIGNALSVAMQTRAGIRIPANSNAQVSVSLIDLDGNILALARLPDAPIFGIDVSLQKARSAVFFSRAAADPMSAYNELKGLGGAASAPGGTFGYYVTGQSIGQPNLFNQGLAFSVVAIGNFARPFFPDGEDGMPPGPLSLALGVWSPFATGLQTDLVLPDLANALATPPALPASGCGTAAGLTKNASGITQIANGLQIFSGGFPIYRPLPGGGQELIGALGISGDGIQQDALIAYVGIQGDATIGVTGVPTVENAPPAIRADTLNIDGTSPVYIACPPAPFITSREQSPCS